MFRISKEISKNVQHLSTPDKLSVRIADKTNTVLVLLGYIDKAKITCEMSTAYDCGTTVIVIIAVDG